MAAAILAERRSELAGAVKLMFQPAEEGPGGALPMIEEGLLEKPRVEAAYALHLWNDLPVGKVGVRAGPVFAGVDGFDVTVHGRGGHGAAPHEAVDPVPVAARMVGAFQEVITRRIDPLKPAVITVGRIAAGVRENIIPERAEMEATVRYFDPGVRTAIRRWVHKAARHTAAAAGARAEVRYDSYCPPTVNDPGETELVRRAAQEMLPARAIVEQDRTMGGEDMSFVLARVPGCYVVVGAADPRWRERIPHHSPLFRFDERALTIGIELAVRVVLRRLAR